MEARAKAPPDHLPRRTSRMTSVVLAMGGTRRPGAVLTSAVESGEERSEHAGDEHEQRQELGEAIAHALAGGGDVFGLALDAVRDGGGRAVGLETLGDDPFLVTGEDVVELSLGEIGLGAAAI